MVPKVPMALEKVRITAESIAGSTRGRGDLPQDQGLAGSWISPISSSSELMEFSAADTSRYVYA